MPRKHRERTLAVVPSLSSGLTATEIAIRHNVPLSTVYYLAREHGVTLPQSDWRRQNLLRLHKDPAFKAKISAAMKKKHKDPKFRERIQAAASAANKRRTKLRQTETSKSLKPI